MGKYSIQKFCFPFPPLPPGKDYHVVRRSPVVPDVSSRRKLETAIVENNFADVEMTRVIDSPPPPPPDCLPAHATP